MKTTQKFKQTEIGEIPEDWGVITFDNAFNFLSTASYSRDQLSNNEEILYVHYGDIHTTFNHFLDFTKANLPSISNIQLKKYSLIKEGDLIIVDASEDYAGISKSVEVKNLEDKKSISGLHTFLLRDKNNNFVNGFKGYIHVNRLVKSQYDRLATGLKVYGVSKSNLKLVQIPLPPKPEQINIASTLSDTDVLIESFDKLIVKKKNIKQGAMQELLTGKRRLPGFKGEWETKKLGEVADFYNGKAHERFISDNGDYIVVNSKFISTESEVYKNSSVNFFPLKEKDITMVMSDIPNGKALAKCFIIPKNDKYALNQRICAIKTNSVDYKFLYFILNRNEYYLAFDSGSGQTNLKKDNVLNCPLKLPPTKEEQSAISLILSEMDLEIEQLEQKRDKYKEIKTGMMQELLTGRIRLK